MKYLNFSLTIIGFSLLSLSFSCKSERDEEPGPQLSDEEITANLAKQGKCDPALLIGRWDSIRYAYTSDGNKIFYEVATTMGYCLVIPTVPTPSRPDSIPDWKQWWHPDLWYLIPGSQPAFCCSLSGNLIFIKNSSSTYAGYGIEQNDLVFALVNSYSFVIKGNELIIYFTGKPPEEEFTKDYTEKFRNKNLLIFKRKKL